MLPRVGVTITTLFGPYIVPEIIATNNIIFILRPFYAADENIIA